MHTRNTHKFPIFGSVADIPGSTSQKDACRQLGHWIGWIWIASLWLLLFSHDISPLLAPPPCSFDLNLYSLIGRGIFDNMVPYRDLFDHKGPLTFFIYGFCTLPDIDSHLGIYLLQCILQGTTLYYINRIARLFLTRKPAFLLTLCTPLLVFGNFGGNPSEFILPFQFLTLYYLILLCQPPHRAAPFFLIGLSIAWAFWQKFNLTAFWIPILTAAYIVTFRHQGRAALTSAILRTGLGFITLSLPILAYFLWHQSCLDLLQSYFLFNIRYGAQSENCILHPSLSFLTLLLSPASILRSIPYHFPYIGALLGLLLLFGGMVIYTAARHNRADRTIQATLWISLTLCLTTTFGSFHFHHYYTTLHPFYIITLIALAAIIAKRLPKKWRTTPSFITLVLLATGTACALGHRRIAPLIRQNATRHQMGETLRAAVPPEARSRNLLILPTLPPGLYGIIRATPPIKYMHIPAGFTSNTYSAYDTACREHLQQASCTFALAGGNTHGDLLPLPHNTSTRLHRDYRLATTIPASDDIGAQTILVFVRKPLSPPSAKSR